MPRHWPSKGAGTVQPPNNAADFVLWFTVYIYIYVCVYIYIYIHIYIYILSDIVHVDVYIYIYLQMVYSQILLVYPHCTPIISL